VNLQSVLSPHYQSSGARAAREPVVLAVQDTTSLNYSTHPATELLGPIGSQADGAVGMLVHSTLAFNLAGTPLGLLDVQCWVRDPEEFGKKHQRYELPLEAKESVRWLRSLQAVEQRQAACPQTRFIGVGDREADIYELFVWAKEKSGRPGLLVRAERERLLTQEQGPLWAHVESQPVAGQLEIKVPRRGNRAARVAVLEVRFAAVELRAPKRKSDLPPVTLWAVLAREVGAPPGTEALEWMLLSTEPVRDFETGVEKLRWYTLRWGIEVFHRVLKSGCQIETRRLGHADRLEACLGIDLVVAWRIYHLTKLGRETPAVPCTVYFEEHEWQALVAFVARQPEPPKEPPTLREAVRMVAGLGGFLARKGDGEPGTETLWRGLQRLDDIAEAYLVFRSPPKKGPVSSDRRYG
jgi:transposase Tn5 family protein